MNFDVDVDSFFGDEAAVVAAKAVTVHQVYGFGVDWSDTDRFTISHMFGLTKKKINHMRMQVSPVGRNFLHRMNTNTDACAEEEAEISEFMAAIRSYFSDESVRSRDSDISFHLLNEMKLLLVFLGRVCDLNDALLMEGCKDSKSIEGSYVRLLLRIWSCSLETAFLASQSSLLPADIQLVVPTDFTGPLPSQILSLLMADLMSICWNRFVSFPVNGDLTTLSPFPAHFFNREVTEIRETVLKYQNADSYWSVVNMIIQRTEDWNEQDSQSIYHFPLLPRSLKKAKETKIAQLWLFLILSRNQTPPCSLNPNVLVSLVKDVVQRDTPFLDSSCTNILLVIQIVRSLFESLNPNVDLLFPFFELLIKRLNKSDGLLTRELPKHGSEWAQLITHPKPYNDTRQDLCLSVLSLVELIARNQGPEGDLERSSQLQRLKGRLYSKIQPKRLLDVSEHGLFKFLSFFVGIGSWKPDQWPEMSDKVCEIAHKIFERGENCKILLTVKCLFALLYLMPANCDASRVKQILIRQIPLLSSPDSKHPIALAFFLSGKVNNVLVDIIFEVLRNFYLSRNAAAADAVVGSLEFLKRIHTNSKTNDSLHNVVRKEMRLLLPHLIEKLVISDAAVSSAIQGTVQVVVDDMKHDVPLLRETIFPVVREFAAKFLDSAANSVIGKVFAALEIFIRACPELTRGTETIFGILSGIISDIERRRRTGTETEMRRNLNEILRKCSK